MRTLAAFGWAWVAACGGSHVAEDVDVGPFVDAAWTPDASMPDSALDGGADASDAALTSDAEVDSPDAAVCECGTPPPCFVARCEEGVCVEEPMPDGASCGEDESLHCVASECVVRACGDGYREPDGALREGCDDGNLIEGDGCSSACEPTVSVLAVEDDERRFVETAAAGEAVVWIEEERATAMRTLRLVRDGEETLVAGPVPWIAHPSVAVDDEDTVVAYETARGVELRRVRDATSTAMAPVDGVNVAAASTGEGVVVAWREEDGRIWIREHRGSIRMSPAALSVGATGALSVTTNGREGVVAWESEGQIWARAFSSGEAAGDVYLVADEAIGPRVTGLGGFAFAFSWTSFADDFFGNVIAGELGRTVTVAESDARERSRQIVPFGRAWAELHEVGPLALPVLGFGDTFVPDELAELADAIRFADPQTTSLTRTGSGATVAWIGSSASGERELATFFLPDS
ncbi:MAG: hypothetical protein AAGE52_42515 [Myxococcota bacterium]